MRINDVFTGLLIVAFAVLVLVEAATYRGLPGVPYGPGLFPSLIAWCMLLGGGVLILQGAPRLKDGWLHLETWARQPRSYATLGIIFASLLFYILISEEAGFTMTSASILFALMLWTRGRKNWRSSLVIAAVFSLAIYWIFSNVLRVPLPQGLLEKMI